MKKMVAVSAVLAVFCLLAITPTNSFAMILPSESYEIESIRLYEAGELGRNREQRDYKDAFPKTTTRYIYVEVDLRNIMFGLGDQSHKLLIQFWNPDETLRGEIKRDITIESEWPVFWYTVGWGWKQPGNWPVGTYKVKVWMMDDGQFLGGTYFIIYNDTGATQDPFEIGRKIALKGREMRRGETWVKDNYTGNSTHTFHVFYFISNNSVVFAARPKDRSKKQVMWGKSFINDTYVEMTGYVNDPELESTISIHKYRAEQEAWRILKYFDR